ncbi:TPA: DUF2267 domain-containing protein [Candidatus Berkelbacteria bacterium]|uniref:DUF2267 domain-containing protein n=1 Tax=Berkelbacteria bacterium GW2011_GWE1_39_12 TaxID=1618337 RepID=A0A0G4B397_9BACT|nr:MAG: hypothetical protein UT28_C0001G0620 [Berkelbacteria bacterium GW2011_GWE1_39_12]HBO61012.1 DUF2267 domain-containing protein [Candidatus Berkelbacteria bacterium]
MFTGLDVLDTTVQKTNIFLGSIENDLGWEGHRHQAYQATRAVLHALRDRLPIDLEAHLAAELPLFLKGVFFEGWSPARVPLRMNKEEFIQYIRQNFIFDVKENEVEKVINVVGKRIFELIGPEETKNILQALSSDVAELFE